MLWPQFTCRFKLSVLLEETDTKKVTFHLGSILERTYELDSLDGLFSYRLTIIVECLPYKPSKMRLLGHLFMALSKTGALVEIFFLMSVNPSSILQYSFLIMTKQGHVRIILADVY